MINGLIALLKYPVALLVAGLTWELFKIFWNIIITIAQNQERYDYFFMGMGLYILTWFVLFPKREGKLLMILEHELTHAIFAILSFKKILGIFAHIHHGGLMSYVDKNQKHDNWLITISPYFFSILGMIVIALLHIATPSYYPILEGMLGYVVVHHLHTIVVMTSPKQRDIKKVGYLFASLFLPGANLMMLILFLTQIPNDGIDLTPVVAYLHDLVLYYMEILKAYIMNWL